LHVSIVSYIYDVFSLSLHDALPIFEGILESFIPFQHPVVWSHHAGWYYQDGTKGYFYGTGVPADYTGVVPSKFEIRDIPESYYRSEEHTSELQSRFDLVCRLLLEKK